MNVHLDTHAAVLLWEGRVDAFGRKSRRLLERGDLAVAAVVRLELRFLWEIERLTVDPDTILGGLEADCRVRLLDDTASRLVSAALPLAWTRDPFDRLIVAAAWLHDARLVTRDDRIAAHFDRAVW